jgi:hypothetical protein
LIQHVSGARGIAANQSAQIRQCFKQHVRIELALQQLELRIGGLALSALARSCCSTSRDMKKYTST